MKEVIEMEVVEIEAVVKAIAAIKHVMEAVFIEFYIATLLCHLVVLQLQIMVVGSGVAWC